MRPAEGPGCGGPTSVQARPRWSPRRPEDGRVALDPDGDEHDRADANPQGGGAILVVNPGESNQDRPDHDQSCAKDDKTDKRQQRFASMAQGYPAAARGKAPLWKRSPGQAEISGSTCRPFPTLAPATVLCAPGPPHL
jgi:hypothetical protein